MIKTISAFKNNKKFILAVGYCELPHLLGRVFQRVGCWSNIYGWRADFYEAGYRLGVITGYDTKGATIGAWNLNDQFNAELKALDQRAKAWTYGDDEEQESIIDDFAELLEKAYKGEFDKIYRGYIDGKLWASGKTKAEMRSDFYASRVDTATFYRLDHTPKYKDLTVKFE